MTFLYALHCTQPLVHQRGFENISSMLEGFHDISLAMRGPLYDHWRIELHDTLRSSPPNGFSNPSLSGGLSRYELRREGSSHCIAHNTLSTRGVSNPCLMLKAFHDTSLTMKGLQHYLLRIVLHTQPLVRQRGFRMALQCLKAFTIWVWPWEVCNMTYALYCTQHLVRQSVFWTYLQCLRAFTIWTSTHCIAHNP